MFTLRFFEGGLLGSRVSGSAWKHASTARKEALLIATGSTIPIAVMRDEKTAYIMHPTGRTERPPASAPMSPAEDCVRGTGLTCFCSPCRAARRS